MKKILCMLLLLIPMVLIFTSCGEPDIDDIIGSWAYNGKENHTYTFDKSLTYWEDYSFGENIGNTTEGKFQFYSGILVLKYKGSNDEVVRRYKVEIDDENMTWTDSNGEKTELVKKQEE